MKLSLKAKSKVLIIIFIAIGLFEFIGYVGIVLLSRSYKYSPFVDMSSDYVSKENPYLRLRKILIGVNGYQPRCYSSYNLNYGLTLNYNMDGVKIHNEDGYRGKKVNCEKGDKYRILFLGGYGTYGMLKDPDASYPAQTGMILNEYFKKDSIEVINGGIPEGTSAEDLNFYLHKFRYYRANLVVINSGSTDGHVEVSDDDFTPDYSNHRNYELFQVERILPSVMFRSYFISFLAIGLYYHPNDVDIERGSTLLHVPKRPCWFPNELKEKIKSGDLSYHPYYNNLRTLVTEIISDSSKVLLIPTAINTNWKYYHKCFNQNFSENITVINRIIEKTGSDYKLDKLNFQYQSISPEFWNDYSNLTKEGENQKARLVADKIISIMKESKNNIR